jgi:glyoxylase-like metal-dependent hydrolase (beta-lactamase superfamily II)
MSTLQIQHFFDSQSNTYSYVVYETVSKDAVVIDPVLDFDTASGSSSTIQAEQIVRWIKAAGLHLKYILETHVHADHLTAAPFIKAQCGGQTAIGSAITEVQTVFAKIFGTQEQFACDGRQFDLLLADGAELPLGSLTIKVLHTPGHTPACVSYLIDNTVFVGDTLFMPDYGTARCDFPGGDADTLYRSVQKLFNLPDQTRMMMCHDYGAPGRADLANETTVAAQKACNIHVGAAQTQEQFVALRHQRDATLAMPKLLLPAVQVNMRAGNWPEPESNGVSYLKLPINLFAKK